jgi:hypothetical protein
MTKAGTLTMAEAEARGICRPAQKPGGHRFPVIGGARVFQPAMQRVRGVAFGG